MGQSQDAKSPDENTRYHSETAKCFRSLTLQEKILFDILIVLKYK